MKSSKNKLIKATRAKLITFGYQEFEDSQTGSNGLFIKLIKPDYFLTLGLIHSNYYTAMFSASFYLSKTTRWGSVWGDIPKESYQRIGSFLTKNERRFLLDEQHNKEGVVDAWWNNDEQGIANFLKTIELTENRFLMQEGLFSKIENSLDMFELVNYSSGVIGLVKQSGIPDQYGYKFIPDKPIDGVPQEWFMAAEIVLASQNGILNKNTVKLLAIDSWRQDNIKIESQENRL